MNKSNKRRNRGGKNRNNSSKKKNRGGRKKDEYGYCIDHNKGKCKFGDKCKYVHRKQADLWFDFHCLTIVEDYSYKVETCNYYTRDGIIFLCNEKHYNCGIDFSMKNAKMCYRSRYCDYNEIYCKEAIQMTNSCITYYQAYAWLKRYIPCELVETIIHIYNIVKYKRDFDYKPIIKEENLL